MLTPEDIASRSFLVSRRGFDREQVKSFLAEVADEVADLQERIAELEQSAIAEQLSRDEEREAAAAAQARDQEVPEGSDSPVDSERHSQLFAEIARETQRILEAAREAGEELRRTAHEDAQREVKTARVEATRIIAEGERHREAMEREVGELVTRRDAIAAELREVGLSIERALRELLDPPEAAGTMREALSAAARDEELARAAERASAPASAPAPAEPEPEESPLDTETAAAAAPAATAEPAAVAAPALPSIEVAPGAAEPVAEEPEAEQESQVEEAAAEEPELAQEPGVEEATAEEPDPAEEPPGEEPVAEVATIALPWPADEAAVIEEAHSLRARALAPLHPKLVRKLKRGLQELQNDLLDRVRRSAGRGDVDRFLPDAQSIAALAHTAEEFLDAAWRAGTSSGQALADGQASLDDDSTPAEGLGQELAGALGLRLMADLEKTLSTGIAAGEGGGALEERISAVFSDLKEEPVEEHAALALLRIYEDGLLSAWRAGGVAARRWVPVAEHGCGDPRCDDNHRAGPVPLDEPFLSGHTSPPVRIGCNCTTVPAVSESELAS